MIMHLHLPRINNLGSFSTAALPCGRFIPRRPWGGSEVRIVCAAGWPCGLLDQSHTGSMALPVSFRFRSSKRGAVKCYELRNRDTGLLSGGGSAPCPPARLDPWPHLTKEWVCNLSGSEKNVPLSSDDRREPRNDLAWAIAVGGIAAVTFASLLLFTWAFAATLFLIFAGVLLGVTLNAMTHLLGRVVGWPHWLRLAIVCLVSAGLLSGA